MNEAKNFTQNWPIALLSVTFAFSALLAASTYRYSATHSNDVAVPTITVSGTGEASGRPDIATVTFSITQVSPNVKDAQKKVEETTVKVMEGLKGLSVSDKDIKTESYTVTPKYSYPQVLCLEMPCPSSSPKLEGYEVSTYISITVRNIDSAGDVIALLGKNEVKDISGPRFAIENTDKLIAEARALAVEKAKTKAKETASSLGRSLGDIRVYSEGNGGGYMPMYAKSTMADGASFERVTLSQGETKVTVDVSLTYSIK